MKVIELRGDGAASLTTLLTSSDAFEDGQGYRYYQVDIISILNIVNIVDNIFSHERDTFAIILAIHYSIFCMQQN